MRGGRADDDNNNDDAPALRTAPRMISYGRAIGGGGKHCIARLLPRSPPLDARRHTWQGFGRSHRPSPPRPHGPCPVFVVAAAGGWGGG
jgi:hypothetical protein